MNILQIESHEAKRGLATDYSANGAAVFGQRVQTQGAAKLGSLA